MNDIQFKIIGHTLGVNTYHCEHSDVYKDKFLPDEFYRNYFCLGSDRHHEYKEIKDLVESGLMEFWNKFENLYAGVTEKGIQLFREKFTELITSVSKKPSRSKQRYQDFINSDCGLTFAEYIGIQLPILQHGDGTTYHFSWWTDFDNDYNSQWYDEAPIGYRFVSSKYYRLCGNWCKTEKEAKGSYKKALRDHLKKIKEGIING